MFSVDLIPFYSFFTRLRRSNRDATDVERNGSSSIRPKRKWRGPTYPGITCVIDKGDVLPLEILCHISNWFAVLEDRGTVPGSSLGTMIGTIGALEDTLSGLERIITTNLPFIYSVHIRQTVWIYLLLLPFQIVEKFGWFTIPASFLAGFIYLGFLSAGEEIEQPFGYDEDDLDLDAFCYEIHLDMEHLKGTRCINSYMGSEIAEHGNTIWRQSEITIEGS
jgi:predicted membrane chloride channel (bestrophin family)